MTSRSHFVWFAALGLGLLASDAAGQKNDPLEKRWVGTLNRQALFLDFFGDSMLVVNDRIIMDYWAGPDSIIAYNADTSFALQYRAVYDKLLIETADGITVTMSPQPIQARPVFSGFGWDWGRWIARSRGEVIQLYIKRIGNGARFTTNSSARKGLSGRWRRAGRTFTFTWETPTEENPDSTQIWMGHFDAEGHQFLFDDTGPETDMAIFRRRHRGRAGN
jgi:hypothetical protein